MSLRFLVAILASGLPEESNQSTNAEINISRYAEAEDYLSQITFSQTPAKFHIGMLTISLLVGLAYGGYTAYTCWMEKSIFLGYIRNLVIALVCRTFFSIVFDGAILLGSPLEVGGGNFLLSCEQICLNLVIAFWLTLNIYLHERVQRNFNTEPTLMIYQFGVPCVALFFAFVWIFTLQDQVPSFVWWILLHPFTQWIVNSINLLYLLIQLGLLGNIIRIILKITLDNDAVSLLRKISAMMGIMVLIFWLQFGLSVGRIPLKATESYLYFFYFVDGLECALICSILYFFYKWVLELKKVSSLISRIQESPKASEANEIIVSGGRGIKTIDSVFMTRESRRWKIPEEESKDVVYSNIIKPERLKKTLDLYKRLNIIPTNQVTTVEGEEFYDCQLQNSLVSENLENNNFAKRTESLNSNISRNKVLNEDKSLKKLKVSEQKQKKNAFYSSKYLILDTKESDIPKYLETRPSVSSVSGKSSPKDERINTDFPSFNATGELVQKWLDDNSEIMQRKEKKKKPLSRINKEKKPEISYDKDSESDILEHQLEPKENALKETEDQTSPHKMILSAINSVVSSVFFGSNTSERKSLDKEMANNFEEQCSLKQLEIHKTDPPEKETIKISDKTEKKLVESTNINPEKETEFYAVKVEEKIEIEKPLDQNEKKSKSNKQNILQPQIKSNTPSDIKINVIAPNELPDDSYDSAEHDKPLNDTEMQQVQETPLPKRNEDLTLEDEPSKLPHTEPYPKEPPKENEDDEIKVTLRDITNKESQTSNDYNEKLTSLESEQHSICFLEKDTTAVEEEKVLGELANEFKLKPELTVSDIPDDSVEVLKNNLSPSHTVTALQIKPLPKSKDVNESEPELDQSLNQYITYSDLLEFRSQRDKSANARPTGVSKRLFDFSEVLSSTISSWISAGSSFFTTGTQVSDFEKENESVISEFENEHKLDIKKIETHSEKSEKKLIENHQRTDLSMLMNEPDVTATSDSEFSLAKKRNSTSSAGSFSVDQYYLQLMKVNEKFYNHSNSFYEKQKKEKTF